MASSCSGHCLVVCGLVRYHWRCAIKGDTDPRQDVAIDFSGYADERSRPGRRGRRCRCGRWGSNKVRFNPVTKITTSVD
jgi:hypothetical protein